MTHGAGSIYVVAAATVIGSGTMVAKAQPLLSINDGFGSGSFNTWSVVVSPEAQSGTFLTVGGNPGYYASLIATTSPNNRTGTGFQYRGVGSTIVLGSAGTQITIGADLRRTSLVTPGTPTPEFVPMIIQGTRLYQPASFIAAPTSDQWLTVAPVTFNISEFTNSTGVPLNLAASVTVGFWLRINAEPLLPPGRAYGVGVDNLRISVIPGPSAVATVLVGLGVLTRRRWAGRHGD